MVSGEQTTQSAPLGREFAPVGVAPSVWVRRALKLDTGSRVEFVEQSDGSYELIAATRSVKELKGILKSRVGPVSIEDMNEAVLETAAERARR